MYAISVATFVTLDDPERASDQFAGHSGLSKARKLKRAEFETRGRRGASVVGTSFLTIDCYKQEWPAIETLDLGLFGLWTLD